MADIYVYSGGNNSTGADWTTAYTSLTNASVLAAANTDRILVAHDHAETPSSTQTYDFANGTLARPMPVLCVNRTSGNLTTGATVTLSSTAGNDFNFGDGSAYFYGIEFKTENGAYNSNFNFTVAPAGATLLIFDHGALTNRATGAASTTLIGHTSNDSDAITVRLIATNIAITDTDNLIKLSRHVTFEWFGGSLTGSNPPTGGFIEGNTASTVIRSSVTFVGVDLNVLGSNPIFGANFIGVGKVINCRLGASASLSASMTWYDASTEMSLECSDSADTNYRYEQKTPLGVTYSETAIYPTSGYASHDDVATGTKAATYKMVPDTTNVPQMWRPFYSPWIYRWLDTTAASKTISLKVAYDAATVLKDNELAMEVEYMGDSTNNTPLYSFGSTVPAYHPAATGSDLTDTSESWEGDGAWSNGKYHTLSMAITNQSKGWIRCRVALMKAASAPTIYVDRKIGVA